MEEMKDALKDALWNEQAVLLGRLPPMHPTLKSCDVKDILNKSGRHRGSETGRHEAYSTPLHKTRIPHSYTPHRYTIVIFHTARQEVETAQVDRACWCTAARRI